MPNYQVNELAPGITQHRFYRGDGWQEQFREGTPEHPVLSAMNDRGAYSLVKVERGRTSAIGRREGVENPRRLVERVRGPAVAVNFGFFVHYPYLYRENESGSPLGRRYYGSSVGATRTTDANGVTSTLENTLNVSPGYGDLIVPRPMDDGTYVTVGPSLNRPLDIQNMDYRRLNSLNGRFEYFAKRPVRRQELPSADRMTMLRMASRHGVDAMEELRRQEAILARDAALNQQEEFERIPSARYQALEESDQLRRAYEGTSVTFNAEIEALGQMERVRTDGEGRVNARAAQSPENQFTKSLWSQVPGNLSHVREPNERSGVSVHRSSSDAVLYHAYTSVRSDGLPMNDFRQLMLTGSEFAGHPIQNPEENHRDILWANDGGPSIFQMFIDEEGNRSLLAQGGLEDQSVRPELGANAMRAVPNAMVARPSTEPGLP